MSRPRCVVYAVKDMQSHKTVLVCVVAHMQSDIPYDRTRFYLKLLETDTKCAAARSLAAIWSAKLLPDGPPPAWFYRRCPRSCPCDDLTSPVRDQLILSGRLAP